MLPILKFSGAHWARTALVWLFFAALVDGLADPSAEAADSVRPASGTASASDGSHTTLSHLEPGRYQVAKVEVVDLDVSAISEVSFGDAEETAPAKP